MLLAWECFGDKEEGGGGEGGGVRRNSFSIFIYSRLLRCGKKMETSFERTKIKKNINCVFYEFIYFLLCAITDCSYASKLE